jgi:DNA-binding response OmpR family regulator
MASALFSSMKRFFLEVYDEVLGTNFVRSTSIDFILLHIKMPQLAGLDVCFTKEKLRNVISDRA